MVKKYDKFEYVIAFLDGLFNNPQYELYVKHNLIQIIYKNSL